MKNTKPILTAKGQKRQDAILDAAAKVFIQHGYEGTTLDMIIEQSGGSRSTLYQNFGDKKGLFKAIAKYRIEDIFADNPAHQTPKKNVKSLLYYYGMKYLESMFHPESIGLYRLILAEFKRFPEISQLFYQSGPEKYGLQLAQGLANLDDVHLTKETLIPIVARYLEMLKADLFLKFCGEENFTVDKPFIEQHLELSIDIITTYIQHINKKALL